MPKTKARPSKEPTTRYPAFTLTVATGDFRGVPQQKGFQQVGLVVIWRNAGVEALGRVLGPPRGMAKTLAEFGSRRARFSATLKCPSALAEDDGSRPGKTNSTSMGGLSGMLAWASLLQGPPVIPRHPTSWILS